MGYMKHIESITFTEPYRCFAEGETYDFRDITMLVGDQGSGKSSLLQEIRNHAGPVNPVKGGPPPPKVHSRLKFNTPNIACHWFDFRNDDPRTRGIGRADGPGAYTDAFFSRFCSHGELNLRILQFDYSTPAVYLLDEPEMALSPRSIMKLNDALRNLINSGSQVFLSCHHPWLMEAWVRVLDLEKKEWRDPCYYLREIKDEFGGDDDDQDY